MRNRRAGLLAAATALALSACAAVGPDFKPPAGPTGPGAQGYAMAGDPASAQVRLGGPAAAGPWWRAFGSPELDRVVNEALANSPTRAEIDANLARVEGQARAVRAQQGPSVNADASAQRARINPQSLGFPGFPAVTTNLYTVGVSAAFDPDVFGGLKRDTENATAHLEGENRRHDAAYLALTGNVVRQAVILAGLNAQLAAAQATVEEEQRLVDLARAAVKAGGRPPSEIAGAQSQLAEEQAALPPLLRQRDAARHQLALLVGKSPADWTAPDFNLDALTAPAEIPVSLPTDLVRQRPDILAAEAELHAATARIGVAIARQYPDFRLTASFAQGALKPDTVFNYSSSAWTLLGGVTAPIFDSGRLKAERRVAEADAQAADARYRTTVLKAFVQVSDILAALGSDQMALDALQAGADASAARVRNAETAYRLGGGMMVEVIDARRQLSLARRSLAAAQSQRFADMAELYVATGADWREAR